MSEINVMTFKVVVEGAPRFIGHFRYRCEAWINEGLDEHLRSCAECRATIVKDLRDYADQIEARK